MTMPSMMPSISRSLSRPPRLPQTRVERGAGGVTPYAKNRPAARPQSGWLPRAVARADATRSGRGDADEAADGRARIWHQPPDHPGHPAREDHERRARMRRESRLAAARSHP